MTSWLPDFACVGETAAKKLLNMNKLNRHCGITILIFAAISAFGKQNPSFETLFEERVRSVVAIEFYVQREEDRQSRSAYGLVIDGEGRIVTLDGSAPAWLPPERLKDIKAYPLGEESDGYDAEYLGQDFHSGNHYFQMEEEAREHFTPITEFGQATPKAGALLWGIGVQDKDWNFLPYFAMGHLSVVVSLPQDVGFLNYESGAPGSALFDETGAFVGWIQNSYNDTQYLTIGGKTHVVQLRDPGESTSFLTAKAFFEDLGRIPKTPTGDPRPWLGVAGIQTLDRETAKFFELDDQGAIVVSDVIANTGAADAGLESKDIIVALDGETIPKFVPVNIVVQWFTREITSRDVGDELKLTVNRNGENLDLTVTLGETPKRMIEAERQFFESIGLTVREFLLNDALNRRILDYKEEGVITEYVSANKPANSAGLRVNDWVKEIDGEPVENFAEAVELLTKIEEDTTREEAVLLIERNNETQVLRIKLN